jgi:raffinose/stachyose/melibiose transport system permease protein
VEKALRNKKIIMIFVLPGLLFYFIIILFPILKSFYYSLYEWNGINLPTYIGFQNYLDVFKKVNPSFWDASLNSLILAGCSVFIQIPIALVLALILSLGIKGEKMYRTIYFIPVIISTVIIGQLWIKIYHPSYGILNVLLENIGLGSLKREWLAKTETALFATMIPIIWQYVGYHMLLLYTAAKSVSTDIYESARIDGANNFVIAKKITIPLIMPMLKTCVIFAVIGSIKSFDLIYILTKGGPMHATEVPSTLMYNSIFVQYGYGYGSSMAIIIIIECLVFTLLIQKLFPKEKIE